MKQIGSTGAGLDPQDITKGSDIANVIGRAHLYNILTYLMFLQPVYVVNGHGGTTFTHSGESCQITTRKACNHQNQVRSMAQMRLLFLSLKISMPGMAWMAGMAGMRTQILILSAMCQIRLRQ
jgi:hypothetical protein